MIWRCVVCFVFVALTLKSLLSHINSDHSPTSPTSSTSPKNNIIWFMLHHKKSNIYVISSSLYCFELQQHNNVCYDRNYMAYTIEVPNMAQATELITADNLVDFTPYYSYTHKDVRCKNFFSEMCLGYTESRLTDCKRHTVFASHRQVILTIVFVVSWFFFLSMYQNNFNLIDKTADQQSISSQILVLQDTASMFFATLWFRMAISQG